MTQITDHLADIERRVASSLMRAHRLDERVTIVAVSKQQSTEAIEEAFAAGQRHFGENYLQEALVKMEALSEIAIEWHFIGTIQSNKTRTIAERFDWVQTIDRARVAERLDAQRPADSPPLNALIQVNLAGEMQKGGVSQAGLPDLADRVATLPRLVLRGLMAMPPVSNTESENRAYFSAMRSLLTDLCERHPSANTLSLGMSKDFELAIQCGSNMVRIGTAIFGERAARSTGLVVS